MDQLRFLPMAFILTGLFVVEIQGKKAGFPTGIRNDFFAFNALFVALQEEGYLNWYVLFGRFLPLFLLLLVCSPN